MKFYHFFALIVLVFALNSFSYDDLDHAPPSFAMGEGQAVFVDFTSANYIIEYRYPEKIVVANSRVEFEMNQEGFPILDIVPEPIQVTVDGKKVEMMLFDDPEKVSKFRIITTKLSAGHHILKVTSHITKNVKFENMGVHSAFWMSDLAKRSFLERYLPTNLEFDQYKIALTIRFTGVGKEQKIYTNGKLIRTNDNEWSIEFPDYYTTSSLYYHTAPVGHFEELNLTWESTDGREIPFTIYAKRGEIGAEVHNFKKRALITLGKLEKSYGPWPHNSITIYGVGRFGIGGMEYCGATMTDYYALSHELTHSYFARGIMPSSGNAGWLDEAIVSWRDRGYQASSEPNFTESRMAGHSPYTRITDSQAYFQGASFMSWLNHLLEDKGGLKAFLNALLMKRLYTPINTSEFQEDLEEFAGRSFSEEFDQYIYGVNMEDERPGDTPVYLCPYQLRLTDAEYMELL